MTHHPIHRPLRAGLIGASMLAIAALAGAGSASAQSDDGGAAQSVSVRYADLDLGSTAGAKAMLARIHYAAGQVCGREPDIRTLDSRAQFARCRTEAISHALHDLHETVAGRTEASVVIADK